MPWPWHDSRSESPNQAAPSRTTTTLSGPLSAKGQAEVQDRTEHGSVRRIAQAVTSPINLLTTLTLTTLILTSRYLYTARFRRIPNTAHLPADYLLSRPHRSLYGSVTSVGDPDNFRLYHTPGGIFSGWQWLRHIPKTRKALSGQTLHIRIAGIDAPEMAHFGRPAQPYADMGLDWLTKKVQGRKIRVYTLRRDQYERVVGTAFLRRSPWEVSKKILTLPFQSSRDATLGPLLLEDVGLDMIRAGWATVYEARFGAEFGEKGMEEVYKEAERKAKLEGRGMWVGSAKSVLPGGIFQRTFSWLPWRRKARHQMQAVELESPRQYKTRMAKAEGKGGSESNSNGKN